jgi:hypothetical protein
MKTEAYKKWVAYLCIPGSEQTKYGSLLKGFVSQFSLGNDQYPKTLTATTNVLSNHKIDQRYYDNQKKNCERLHDKPTANDEGNNTTCFAQREHKMTCYYCGKKGHLNPECDKKNTIPREQWHVNQAMQHLQEGNGTDDAADDTEYDNALTGDDESIETTQSTSSENCRSGTPRQIKGQTQDIMTWSGFQVQQENYSKQQSSKVFEHLQDVILLETGSTLKAPFMNPNLVTNIH